MSFSKNIAIKQLYIFFIIFTVASSFYNTFYSVFLYQNFFDLRILVIDTIVFNIFYLIGYFISCYSINRLGYIPTLRISTILFFVSCVITFLYTKEVHVLFILFSVLRGIPAGMNGAVNNSYLLREIRKGSRRSFFYIINSFNLVSGIILPVFIGSLINITNSYQSTFLISSILYLCIAIFPFRHNRVPNTKINFKEVKSILKHKDFKEFTLNKIIIASADTLNAFVFTIVPYLLIKSEFKVGALASITALFGAILSLILNKYKVKKQLHLGYLGASLRIIFNTSLVVFWNTPSLIIRSLLTSIFSTFTDPVSQNIEMKNTEKVIDKKFKFSIEINIINEIPIIYR